MAKKAITEPIKYVTCGGCIFLEPLSKGHGWCKHKRVNMIQVVSKLNWCVFNKTKST